ncbi:DUF3046 domain-containing protein [Streptomyces tardus]|uniref:DUF3046 domain-containing protein n=1 Tax=Streptomyces tardus TaxID=2780544 RepID=UPI003556B9A6
MGFVRSVRGTRGARGVRGVRGVRGARGVRGDGARCRARDTGVMRLTIFWERMSTHFGAAYADSFARDHVMSELGGRTVHEALDAGWDAKSVWRAVCRAVDVPAELR